MTRKGFFATLVAAIGGLKSAAAASSVRQGCGDGAAKIHDDNGSGR